MSPERRGFWFLRSFWFLPGCFIGLAAICTVAVFVLGGSDRRCEAGGYWWLALLAGLFAGVAISLSAFPGGSAWRVVATLACGLAIAVVIFFTLVIVLSIEEIGC